MASPVKSSNEVKANRRALSLTSMYFNRFLVFRYVTAIFFFVNLYWAIILFGSGSGIGLLPSVLLIGTTMVMVEQVGKLWKHTNRLTFTRWFYWVQLTVNLSVGFGLMFGKLQVFYPFLNGTSLRWVLSVLSFGILISAFLEYRVFLIEHDKDRYIKHIRQFEANI
ncbi:hypothetical protein [Lactiplantibacillus plantarum]|nr:hypothetical protein [Lactiplantibacillus plantarum]MBS0938026.1 hypothetical protein [Lactiplantibacillus plantarum]MBS0945925.1 hypothetical protein [Lactiplantibacillus plantarum]